MSLNFTNLTIDELDQMTLEEFGLLELESIPGSTPTIYSNVFIGQPLNCNISTVYIGQPLDCIFSTVYVGQTEIVSTVKISVIEIFPT